MIETYNDFFVASTGAAAALIGLLFIAMTIVENRERVSILIASSFMQFINAFFVSLSGLLNSAILFSSVAIIMGGLGLLSISYFLPQAIRAKSFFRDSKIRYSNLFMMSSAVAIYLLQVTLALNLIHNPSNTALILGELILILALFASALVRAWNITRP